MNILLLLIEGGIRDLNSRFPKLKTREIKFGNQEFQKLISRARNFHHGQLYEAGNFLSRNLSKGFFENLYEDLLTIRQNFSNFFQTFVRSQKDFYLKFLKKISFKISTV